QLWGEDDVGGGGELADHRADVVAQLLHHRRRAFLAALERHEGDDRLAGLRVVATRHRRFRDGLVAHQRALDLDRGYAVTRNVHHVVDAAEQPEISVLIDAGAVADEVSVLPAIPVGVLEPLWVAVDAAQHRWPWLADHEVAASAGRDLLARVVEDRGVDRRERLGRGTGLERGDAG